MDGGLRGLRRLPDPVLGLEEAPAHPHLAARGTFVEQDGRQQPGPAPRFSRTPGAVRGRPRLPGEDTLAALGEWGFSGDELGRLQEAGAIAQTVQRQENR